MEGSKIAAVVGIILLVLVAIVAITESLSKDVQFSAQRERNERSQCRWLPAFFNQIGDPTDIPGANCRWEGDNKNYFTKGKIRLDVAGGQIASYNDVCQNSNYLFEYYCDETTNRGKLIYGFCTNGCKVNPNTNLDDGIGQVLAEGETPVDACFNRIFSCGPPPAQF